VFIAIKLKTGVCKVSQENTEVKKLFYKPEERPKRSESLGKIGLALSKAQGEIENAEKDVKGNYGKYSTLAATWNSIRKQLSKNEIAVFQRPMTIDSKPTMCTMLIHSSGEFLDDSELEMKFDNNNRMNAMQALGSAVTYSRRYSLQAAVGIAPEDDDGNGAGNPDDNKGKGNNQNQGQNNNSSNGKNNQSNQSNSTGQTSNTPPPKMTEDQSEQIANLMIKHSLDGKDIENFFLTAFAAKTDAVTFRQADYLIKMLAVDVFSSLDLSLAAGDLKAKREAGNQHPADYVIDDRILSEGSLFKGKKLRQIDEKSIKAFIEATDQDLKAEPKPPEYKLIFEANFKAKSFLKSMGV